MKEVVFIIILLACLLTPFILFGLWWWVVLMGGICIWFGVMELAAYVNTKQTLSQQFWKWSQKNKVKAWIVLIILAIAWALLLVHLGVKLI